MAHGKRYRDARSQVDRERTYSPVEALGMIKGFEDTKFDETVEAHFRLGLNVRHAEQQLRGTLMLPARHRQGGARGRLRRGREGEGGGDRRR